MPCNEDHFAMPDKVAEAIKSRWPAPESPDESSRIEVGSHYDLEIVLDIPAYYVAGGKDERLPHDRELDPVLLALMELGLLDVVISRHEVTLFMVGVAAGAAPFTSWRVSFVVGGDLVQPVYEGEFDRDVSDFLEQWYFGERKPQRAIKSSFTASIKP